MTYQAVMDYLYSQLPMFQKQGEKAYKADLSNIIALCERLGNPQNKFRSVHIAGTNGKGTTAHTLASILQEAGYSTGLYTSPHLKDYRERIRLNGEMISQEYVVDFVSSQKELIEDLKPSFFEISVAMAFAYFRDSQVDIAIIETGLGGRLDSTNIIKPLVSTITSIGMDHAHVLGNTLKQIAKEKAGIIKQDTPVVLPKDLPEGIREVFMEVANERRSNVNNQTIDYVITSSHMPVDISKKGQLIFTSLTLGVKGNYYLKNIPTIIETVEELRKQGFIIQNDQLANGISLVARNTGLKGRWQELMTSPKVIADLGHNEDGWNEILYQLSHTSYKQLRIVLGMVNDKEISKIFDLLPLTAKYYLCEPKIPRAMALDNLKKEALDKSFDFVTCSDVNDCLNLAISESSDNDLVFVGGSTFVVAEIEAL